MSTPDKNHDSGDVPETEFGKKEKSRLVELLGDECKRTCLTCKGMGEICINSNPYRCRSCDGRGFHLSVPTGLALIEACRKRGVLIHVLAFDDGYSVWWWKSYGDGTFHYREIVDCKPEDLESAIALAALKGLETREEQENQQQGKK